MKLFDKLYNWCFEEKTKTPPVDNRVYIPCKDFFVLSKSKRVETQNAKIK